MKTKAPKYIDPKIAQIMAAQIAISLLELGIDEPQDKLKEALVAELNEINLSEPVYKSVLEKEVMNNTGILAPVFKSINLRVSIGLQDTTAGLLGAISLAYNWTHSGGGENGYKVRLMVVPSQRLAKNDFVVMSEAAFNVATDYREAQLNEWAKQKEKK